MTAFVFLALPVVVGLLAKGTLLLVSAAVACLLLRRSSAATRHLIWTAALVGVLLLPLVSGTLPKWNVTWGHPAASSPAASPVVSAPPPADTAAPSLSAAPDPVPAPASTAPALVDLPAPAPKPTVPAPFVWVVSGLAVWLVGTLVLLAHLTMGLFRIGQIARQGRPLEGEALPAAEAARKHLGLRRSVRFLRTEADSTMAVPVTWGVFRPVVLLPRQSQDWSDDCLRAALLHEMAHIQRGDWLTQILARLVCALYWWHPLVWAAARQARAESERAADDCVLNAGMTPADYAVRLIEVVRSLPLGARSETAAVAMARPSEVEGRLRAVLARGKSRRPLTRRKLLWVGLVVLLLILPLAALRLTPPAQAQSASKSGAVGGEVVISADGGVGFKNVAPGDFWSVFANGYEISLVAVTQATRTGDEWNMYGGPWWRLDGTPIGSQSGGISNSRHWTVARTHGLTPYTFKIAIRPPGGQWQVQNGSDITFFDQFPGSLQPPVNVPDGHLADGSAPDISNGFTVGTLPSKLYPAGTRSCPVRLGMAAGPWRTSVARPIASKVVWNKAGTPVSTTISLVPAPNNTLAVLCADTQGRKRIFSFTGPIGRLFDIAWQFQAVDSAGRDISLTQTFIGVSKPSIDLAAQAGAGAAPWTTSADIAQIKEFRLKTRPYQTVELRNVPLQPAADVTGTPPASAALLGQASDAQLAQAKDLRAHLQDWAHANQTLLQQMAHAQPGDLAALLRVYDSLESLPFPLWSGDPRLSHGNEEPPFALNLPSHLTLTHLQRSQAWEDARIRTNFARYRDLAVSQSVNVGPVYFTFWASGRITRTTTRDRFLGPGKPGVEDENQQEIVPAFFAAPHTSSQQPPPKSQTDSQLSDLRRTVQADPNNAEAQYQLAQALYHSRDKHFMTPRQNTNVSGTPPPAVLEEAIPHLRKAVALQPDNADWQSTLGLYMENQGHYAEAVLFYKQALHLLGPAPVVDLSRSSPFFTGRAQAQQVFDNQWMLGHALLKMRHFQEAAAQYQAALRFEPRAFWVLLGYGDALAGEGKQAEAQAAWKKVLAVTTAKDYYGQQARARLAGKR